MRPGIVQLQVFVLGEERDAKNLRLTLHRDLVGTPGEILRSVVAPSAVSEIALGFRVVFSIDPRIIPKTETWLWAAFSQAASQGSVRFRREIDSHAYPGGQLVLSSGRRNVNLPGVLSFSLFEEQWQWTGGRQKILVLLVMLLAWSLGLPRSTP